MAKLNGSAPWIRLALTVGAIVSGMALAWGRFGHEVEDNTRFRQTDGAKNTENRVKVEVEVEYIKEKITNIEMVQRQILDEVRK